MNTAAVLTTLTIKGFLTSAIAELYLILTTLLFHTVLLSLFWRRMTALGALAGMLVGALTVILWKPLTGSALYEIVPGFILGLVAIYGVSMLTQVSDKVLSRFDEADKAYKSAH